MDIVQFVYNLLVYVLNTIVYLLAQVLKVVMSILPTSPFVNFSTNTLNSNVFEYLRYLAWLLPIKQMLLIVSAWLGAMLIYYFQSAIMRWIKLIQ